jgi:type I restriction enzyme M protein
MLEPELRIEIDRLWDKFWAGGLPNPVVAIDQMNLLLFLRRLEDLDAQRLARGKGRQDGYESIFSGEAEECRWSWWSNLPAQQMYDHVQQVVIPWMRRFGQERGGATSNLVRDASLVIPSAPLLSEAVATIDRLRISDRNVDVQGDIYEYMLLQLQTAGQLGQFRTPRHVIRAIVEMVDPKIGESVFDPACGTGGFLIGAHQHVLAAGTSPEFIQYDEAGTPEHLLGDRYSEKQWEVLRDPPLYGFDVDAQLVRIGTMNLILHGIGEPKVEYANPLGKAYSHAPRAHVVLANPPFAGSIDKSDVSEDFKTNSTKTELLFLELFIDLLIPGGRAGVIVPEGVLFGSQKAPTQLRKRLLENNLLHAVVSLPPGTFRPYTNSSCAALLFSKGGPTSEVWMFDVQADGYSLDDRREPVPDNDLPELLTRWPNRETGPRSFTVSASDIEDWGYDLSVSTYAPFDMPAVPYEEPQDAYSATTEAIDRLQRALLSIEGEQL